MIDKHINKIRKRSFEVSGWSEFHIWLDVADSLQLVLSDQKMSGPSMTGPLLLKRLDKTTHRPWQGSRDRQNNPQTMAGQQGSTKQLTEHGRIAGIDKTTHRPWQGSKDQQNNPQNMAG